jgi:hypothetical protein
MAALELSKGRDVEYAAGLALALSGGSSRSEALAGDLHSAYVRGEALIGAHRYAEAADEFQKILDHRGIGIKMAILRSCTCQIGQVRSNPQP